MNSYLSEIEDLLQGDTPREKYQCLKDLVKELSRVKGRLDYCKSQLKIIENNPGTDPYTKGYVSSVIKVLNQDI